MLEFRARIYLKALSSQHDTATFIMQATHIRTGIGKFMVNNFKLEDMIQHYGREFLAEKFMESFYEYLARHEAIIHRVPCAWLNWRCYSIQSGEHPILG